MDHYCPGISRGELVLIILSTNSLLYFFYCQITQIERREVDAYIPGRRVPHCRHLVEFAGSDECIRLRHRIDLQGAKRPNNFFMITCTAEPIGACRASKFEGNIIYRSLKSYRWKQLLWKPLAWCYMSLRRSSLFLPLAPPPPHLPLCHRIRDCPAQNRSVENSVWDVWVYAFYI